MASESWSEANTATSTCGDCRGMEFFDILQQLLEPDSTRPTPYPPLSQPEYNLHGFHPQMPFVASPGSSMTLANCPVNADRFRQSFRDHLDR